MFLFSDIIIFWKKFDFFVIIENLIYYIIIILSKKKKKKKKKKKIYMLVSVNDYSKRLRLTKQSSQTLEILLFHIKK